MSKPIAVIIGAGPGIGLAIAQRFARDGYDVGLVARDADRVAALAAQVTAEQAAADQTGVGWAAADVADPQALTEALQRFGDHTGRVDVLHYNTSAFREATATELTAADLLADLAVGTAGLLTAVRAVLPRMREQRTGTILVTGSAAADHPMRAAASLGVQKAALRNLVQVLADELSGEGIHVATVTIRGVLKEGTPFAPERIADVLASLVEETASDPSSWRTVVDYTG